MATHLSDADLRYQLNMVQNAFTMNNYHSIQELENFARSVDKFIIEGTRRGFPIIEQILSLYDQKIQRLFTRKLGPYIKHNSRNFINLCRICDGRMRDTRPTLAQEIETNCGHKFHRKCIEDYMDDQLKYPNRFIRCPTCQTKLDIPENDDISEHVGKPARHI